MLIDGISLKTSEKGEGATFKFGGVYDFYFVNLTPDEHPIHFHLINLQKIATFKISAGKYLEDWHTKNGGEPGQHGYSKISTNMDPVPYKIGDYVSPEESDKIFKDTVSCSPRAVTVVRIKFSKNDGSAFNFDARNNKYVWHCHMLEH